MTGADGWTNLGDFPEGSNQGIGGKANIITDFIAGEDVLSVAMFDGFACVDDFSGSTKGPKFRFDVEISWLQYDADSDGVADFAIYLHGVTQFGAGDFYGPIS